MTAVNIKSATDQQLYNELQRLSDRSDIMHRQVQKALDEIERTNRLRGQIDMELALRSEQPEEQPTQEEIEDGEPVSIGAGDTTH